MTSYFFKILADKTKSVPKTVNVFETDLIIILVYSAIACFFLSSESAAQSEAQTTLL